jgi:hypothetical protein
LIALHDLDTLILVGIGVVVYLVAAAALGVVTRAELRELVRRRGDEGPVATPD